MINGIFKPFLTLPSWAESAAASVSERVSASPLSFLRPNDRIFRAEDAVMRPRLLDSNRPDAPSSFFESVNFRGRDVRLHYFEAGTPRTDEGPLLLIHGFASNAYQWNRVFDELSDRHHVIAIDLPGHGYSDCLDDGNYDLVSVFPEILNAFLDAKGMREVTLVGSSLGGGISQILASGNPRILQVLLFASSGCTGQIEPVAPFIEAVHLSGYLPLDRPPPYFFECLGTFLTLWLYVHPTLATLTAHDVAEFARPYRNSPAKLRARVDLARQIRDLCIAAENQTRLIEIQRAIRQPVLYVASEADRAVPKSVPDAILRLIPNARLLRIGAEDVPTAGHTLMSDTPELALQIIEDFLDGAIDLSPSTAGQTSQVRFDAESGKYLY